MFKYVVTWIISTVVSEPCPSANSTDEFGVGNTIGVCSVFHFSTTEEIKTKEFIVRDSAYTFYNKGKEKIPYGGFGGMGSNITKIKIDSVKVK